MFFAVLVLALLILATAACYLLSRKDPGTFRRPLAEVPAGRTDVSPSGVPAAAASPLPEERNPRILLPVSVPSAGTRELSALILEGWKRPYTEAELAGLTGDELSMLLCGLYAISGMDFPDREDISGFFRSSDAFDYDPNTADPETAESRFNGFQRSNTDLLRRLSENGR